MSQIVKKKKKGRPSKADLAARVAGESSGRHRNNRRREQEQSDVRRTLRRRSCIRYNLIDYDEDYLEDEEESEVDDKEERLAPEDGGERRETNLKFSLRFPNSNSGGRAVRSDGGGDSAGGARRAGRGELEEEEEEESPIVKKRKISGDGDEEEEVEDDYGDNDDEKERAGKGEFNKRDSVHGKSNNVPSQTPMPEKKEVELMLHKLQKKDTYGVYAEPVDPEELPDYHDIIKHPMDFSTVRKKLADGSYSMFEQFESDVYLICSNAMHYNSPDTVYHKQARAIKELAQKKFQRVRAAIEQTRIENEPFEKEAKSEQKTKLNPIVKKQMKKPIGHSTQDPVSSDFTSGAALAATDAHNTSNGVQANNCERPSNNEGLVEGISSEAEGKSMAPKSGRKPLVFDENCRGTYEISNQLVDRSELIFSTFEGEDKQLIPVGLYGEHSYALSLARFAATLGPIVWNIASERIERALPLGSKFGGGWVLEYEPFPTPVLYIASHPQKEDSSNRKLQPSAVSVKTDNPSKTLVNSSEQLDVGRTTSNERPCFLPCSGGHRPSTPTGTAGQQQNPFVRKLQNAALPVKGNEPSNALVLTNDHGENRPASYAKPPQLPVLRGSGPATSTGAVVQQQNPFVRKLQNDAVSVKGDKPLDNPVHANDHGETRPISNAKPPQLPIPGGSKPATSTGSVVQQQNPFVGRLQNASVPGKIGGSSESLVSTSGHLDGGPISKGKSSMLSNPRGSRPTTPTGAVQQQSPFSRNDSMPENTLKNRMEANGPTLTDQNTNPFVHKQFPGSTQIPTSWQVDMIAQNNSLLQPLPFRPPPPVKEGVMSRQEQGLSEPVQAMRLLAEIAPKQQNRMNSCLGHLQVRPSIQSPREGNMSGAKTGTTTARMSGGAGIGKPPVENLSANRNPIPVESGERPVSGTMHFQPESSKVPSRELAVKGTYELQVQNGPLVFPQLMVTDLPRVPLQSPWQGLSPHTKQKQKQDTLPPDLNVAFQSTVDPQQPDLALQL